MNHLLEATLVAKRSIGHNPLVKRIVVATDLSEDSRKTTEYALALGSGTAGDAAGKPQLMDDSVQSPVS
jgi:hypothetical protein